MNTEVGQSTTAPRASQPDSPLKIFVLHWLPVLLWMSVMFGFSTGVGSTQHTSRIIGPLLRWLIPGVSDRTVGRVQTVVRKGAHVAEYAALAILIWRARRRPRRNDPRPWNWSEAAFALAVTALFAVSDEVHQAFVPSREAHVRDVLFDWLGAVLGLLAVRTLGRWRGKW